ncbi:MAG: hypothetical protein KDE53_33545, partial [Caldilineaceae bacterium]|nr:hypothetical protein [Caldilineaceae bacterium]
MNNLIQKGGRWLVLLGVMAIFAACQPITPNGTLPNAPAPATVVPGNTDTGDTDIPAARNQRQVLAMQLGLDLDAVEIVEVEAVTWSDGCLGLGSPVELCLQAETPGYRITLAANGEEYVYHTDEDGSQVRLASASEPQLEKIILDATLNDESGCNTIQVSRDQLAFGRCMATLLSMPILDPARQADIAEFAETFAPFSATIELGTATEFVAGDLQFNGSGTTEAMPAQQRMIAEWARLLWLEAQGGRSGASWGLALAWHREGGIAGFCDDVTVYVTGAVYVTSCRDQEPTDLGHFRLDAEQLATLYSWVNTYAAFDYEWHDPAAADAMTVTLDFFGAGTETVTEPEQLLIVDFAQNLFNEGSMSNTEVPTGCPQPAVDQQLLIQEVDGYCLLYPAAYSLWQQNPRTMEIISDTIMNHVDPRAAITVEDAAGRALEEVVDGLLADYAPPGFNIEPRSVTVAGVEATLLDEVPGQDLTRRVVLIHDGRLYS